MINRPFRNNYLNYTQEMVDFTELTKDEYLKSYKISEDAYEGLEKLYNAEFHEVTIYYVIRCDYEGLPYKSSLTFDSRNTDTESIVKEGIEILRKNLTHLMDYCNYRYSPWTGKLPMDFTIMDNDREEMTIITVTGISRGGVI